MHFFGQTKEQISAMIIELGEPKWRAVQLWNWVYKNGITSFDSMKNIPLRMRNQLNERISLTLPRVVRKEKSFDGTEKFAISFDDGEVVEIVLIPEEDRNTLCVSSQIGCCVNCAFCFTGTQKFSRNLDVHEIVGQVLLARNILNDSGALNRKRTLTNIVFMGMGEPLYNYDNVVAAIRIIMDPNGLAFSKRRITLSTSGIVPFIDRCCVDLGVNLAISLHAPNDEIRSQIMPINLQYDLAQLMTSCRKYQEVSDARRITFEYVMLKGINDSISHARELIHLIKGISAKVNLIPWNPWLGAKFESSTMAQIEQFEKILNTANIQTLIRKSRGQDISAACGQLKTAT
ncbi:MAG: 23S rRNA (adenine(2503)-C(2))-methyltransferase RlmN [Holosporales bacterium]|jgi:23S rRNA (adenine2503-C2)-methyltransferase|nr:23S rRNA (adenine(2503)-C(2))-methyltransferase RlmN [Holosporales bacterium]